MTTYAENNLAQCGYKAPLRVRGEIFAAFESSARYYGDRDIKTAAAVARRTATSLRKASQPFAGMPEGDRAKLADAARVMTAYADELATMARWAKGYHLHVENERHEERLRELDAFADARWGADVSAMRFETLLVESLRQREGRDAFAAWSHSEGRHLDVAKGDFHLMDADSLAGAKPLTERQLAAHCVHGVMASRDDLSKGYNRDAFIFYIGRYSYELYLAHMKKASSVRLPAR